LVLRLLAENTIEEHILDVAEQKRKFADSSITGGCGDVRRKALEGRAGALLLLAL
jgi:SNF2 family DNA or RNA helicase